MSKIYHVSKVGKDSNSGTQAAPFLTIQQAADVLQPGDKVIVHGGEYREWVRPRNGGLHENCRITYEAAEGETVIIKGSERIQGWQRYQDTVWSVGIPNALFGKYNPYAVLIEGDWLVSPHRVPVCTGEVYLNGKSFYEAESLGDVLHPQKRVVSAHETWANYEERVLNPEQSIYQWWSQVKEECTVIYANFHGADPNKELVEVNVRKACFFPEKTGLNYITVRGFEMAQAATMWAPPTANQTGLLGTGWSKGWIIENNRIHDGKCSGISLGKEASTGDNDFTKWGRKPGYQYQMEAVFRAKKQGWSKETIGTHIVRNNVIYDCGQNGIVGHMGGAFSEIYDNEIYNISVKREFYGHELGGIKLHAAIDTQIIHNYIHHCSLGIWLDWQAQGTRVSSNIFDKNNRDFMIEVTHGPYVVDNNIFTAQFAMVNAAQGGAYLHNLCGGFISSYPVLDRATPYHYPHSTDLLGTAPVYGGDDRWYHNIFLGGDSVREHYGTEQYDGHTTSMEEYIADVRALGWGDVEQYQKVKQPVYIHGNLYLAGAGGFALEQDSLHVEDNPHISIETLGREVYLHIHMPEEAFAMNGKVITSADLNMARIPEQRFENPDGTEMVIDRDMLGKERADKALPGPLQNLTPGENCVLVWERKFSPLLDG